MTRAVLVGLATVLIALLPFDAEARSQGADDGARVLWETRPDDRTIDLTILSPSLSTPATVRLLVPRGWSRTARRTWPVLYLLHGGGGDHRDWTANTDVERLTANAGVIVVMPDASACGNYTDWWNYGRGGQPAWEAFHLTELRQILERQYRAGTTRAVAGLSMGGFGAMSYAARNQGMFRAAASFSGAVDSLYKPNGYGLSGPDGVKLTSIGCPGTDWRRVFGDPDAQRTVWMAHNPTDLAARLAGVHLYVASGDGRPGNDIVEQTVRAESEAFVARLHAHGIPVTTRFGTGTHSWRYWQCDLHASFPMLMDAIGASQPSAGPAPAAGC